MEPAEEVQIDTCQKARDQSMNYIKTQGSVSTIDVSFQNKVEAKNESIKIKTSFTVGGTVNLKSFKEKKSLKKPKDPSLVIPYEDKVKPYVHGLHYGFHQELWCPCYSRFLWDKNTGTPHRTYSKKHTKYIRSNFIKEDHRATDKQKLLAEFQRLTETYILVEKYGFRNAVELLAFQTQD